MVIVTIGDDYSIVTIGSLEKKKDPQRKEKKQVAVGPADPALSPADSFKPLVTLPLRRLTVWRATLLDLFNHNMFTLILWSQANPTWLTFLAGPKHF